MSRQQITLALACPKCGTADTLLVSATCGGYCEACMRAFYIQRPTGREAQAVMLERCYRL